MDPRRVELSRRHSREMGLLFAASHTPYAEILSEWGLSGRHRQSRLTPNLITRATAIVTYVAHMGTTSTPLGNYVIIDTRRSRLQRPPLSSFLGPRTIRYSQPRRTAVRLAWKRVVAPSRVISRWTRRWVVRSLQPCARAIAVSVNPAASSASSVRVS